MKPKKNWQKPEVKTLSIKGLTSGGSMPYKEEKTKGGNDKRLS